MLAIRAAALHPDRVRAVVAISPLVYRHPDSGRAHLRHLPVLGSVAESPNGGGGWSRRLQVWRQRLLGDGLSFGPKPSPQAVRALLESCVLRTLAREWLDELVSAGSPGAARP